MTDQYARPEVLVSPDWLQARLGDPSLAIVEVDADPQEAYYKGHIPGAVMWDMHGDLEDPVKRDIVSPSQLEALLGRSGIGNDTTVVLYGDGNNRSATYAFWVLKYYRHGDVRLLNGGRRRWEDEGRPMTTETPRPLQRTYRAPVPDRSLRASKEDILRRLGRPSVKLLDTRTYEEFVGATASSPGGQAAIYRQGRIPGAIHIPWDDGAAEDGSFRPAEELRRLYEAKGILPEHEVITYCRLGVRASYSWFVLSYLLGYPRVRNYDGSWTEWGNSIGVPIERGEP